MADILFAEQTLDFIKNSGDDVYCSNTGDSAVELTAGNVYTLSWDGVNYVCTAEDAVYTGVDIVGFGNKSIMGIGEDTGEPFYIGYVSVYSTTIFNTLDTAASHTVAIYNGGVENEESTNELLPEQVVEFGLDSEESTEYVGSAAGSKGFEVGSTYVVVWDGTAYECECVDIQGMPVIGNTSAFTGTPSDLPFFCYHDASDAENPVFLFATEDTSASHTIAIYVGALEEETPDEPTEETTAGANIVLFDRNGNEVTYNGIETVTFNTDVEGETATYTLGQAVSDVPVELDLSAGNQTVNAETGKLIKSVVIQKPENLKPENIKKDEVVAGIKGTLIGEGVSKTVELDFTNGDQTVVPDEDTLLSEVVIAKPENLLPENIMAGINIAGIIGSLGGAVVKRGSFNGSDLTCPYTLVHNLGVVPDLFMIFSGSYGRENAMVFAVGLSKAFKSAIGHGDSQYYCYSNYNGLASYSSWSSAYIDGTSTSATCMLQAANETTIKVGSSTYPTKYYNYWIAIGGLT